MNQLDGGRLNIPAGTAAHRAVLARGIAAVGESQVRRSKHSITALQARRAEIQEKVAALAAQEDRGVELSAAQIASFDALSAEFNDVNSQIMALEKQEREAAATAVPVGNCGGYSAMKIESQRDTKDVSPFAAYCVAIAAGHGHLDQSIAYAEGSLGMPEVSAALQSSTPSGGGYLVPSTLSNEIIEFLRGDSVCRALGARVVPMPTGNLTLPKMVAGTSASYGTENANIGVTQPQFGEVKLSAKKLTALTPISNDLIRRANLDALRLVQDDLIAAVAEREDLAFIRGDGTGDSPIGINTLMAAGNKLTATGTGTISDVSTDLKRLDAAILGAGVKLKGKVGYVMSPRSYTHLTELRDGQGNRLYPEVLDMQLRGRPIGISHQIPTNLGAGTNETEIYLGVFDHVVIGDALAFSISVSENAYHNGTEIVAAYSRDETVIRIIAEHDIALRHPGAFAKLQGVKW